MNDISRLVERGLLWSGSPGSGTTERRDTEPSTVTEHSRIVKHSASTRQHRTESTLATSLTPRSYTRRNVAAFGVAGIDQLLPLHGLPFGAFHEFALLHAQSDPKRLEAPFWIINALLAQSMRLASLREYCARTQRQAVLWIGKEVWPNPHLFEALYHSDTWRKQFLFLNPKDTQTRFWSIAESARRTCVFAIIANTSGFSPQAYRKLQLALQQGGCLGIFIRRPEELTIASPAYSRWCVSPLAEPSTQLSATTLGWSLTLQKIRGTLHTHRELPLSWKLYWNEGCTDGAGTLDILSETPLQVPRESWTYSLA